MPERVVPNRPDEAPQIREAVSVSTRKIFDGCRDKDCVDDLRVYPTVTSQTYIENALSIRPKAAQLLYAAVQVEPISVIALYDHNMRNGTVFPSNVCSVFVLCRYISGDFQQNPETVGCAFFGSDELPEQLAEGKTNSEQIRMCFEAARDENWKVIFD